MDANKWHKKKQFHPTRFELVKKNRVNNPIDVLDSQTYRTSLFFDDLIPIEEDEFEDRGHWGSKAEFILSCIGFSVSQTLPC